MKQHFQVALLLVVVALAMKVGGSGPERSSYDFYDLDLRYVIKSLAREIDDRPLRLDHAVQGKITIALDRVTPEEGLRVVLRSQGLRWREFGGTLIVWRNRPAQAHRGPDSTEGRREFLLHEVPASQVVDMVAAEYPELVLTPHETENGFFAQGDPGVLDRLEAELPSLDFVSEFSLVGRFLRWDPELEELAERMWWEAPEVKPTVDGRRNRLTIEGPAEAVGLVRHQLTWHRGVWNGEPFRFDIEYRARTATGMRVLPHTYPDVEEYKWGQDQEFQELLEGKERDCFGLSLDELKQVAELFEDPLD